jgi:hypothetical protein
MLTAVDFDDQPLRKAREIHNEAIDRRLPSKVTIMRFQRS